MIYTIGTSNRSLPEFTFELQKRGINHMVDVRSSPYSRLPWFNAPQITRWAERAGIMYRQEGEVLGGRSSERMDGPRYRAALDRLVHSARNESVAIFCAEGKPEDCHRCFEVGAALLSFDGVISVNILRNGNDEDIRETLKRVPHGLVSGHGPGLQGDGFP